MSNNETVQTLSEMDTLKALLGEQANIMDIMARDNVELIAAIKMIISDDAINARLTELGVSDIIGNLLKRIAIEHSED